MNISAKITNLYIYDKIRIMNINAKMWEFIKNNSAEFCAISGDLYGKRLSLLLASTSKVFTAFNSFSR